VRLAAYVLAADPTWIERSVAAYYDQVETILVSYDADGLGWTGSPVESEESLARLRAVDHAGKMQFVGGDHHSLPTAPANETRQRQAAIDALADSADWVLQVDSDEVLPDVDQLITALQHADDRGLRVVEWPMRVLFRQLSEHKYLVVTGKTGRDTFEYPGPVAVRPPVELRDARRVDEAFLRVVVDGDRDSLQVTRAAITGEDRSFVVAADAALLHNSWARSPAVIRRKVRAWAHYEGWRTWRHYLLTWLPSRYLWRWQRDLHPFSQGLWPRLKKVEIKDQPRSRPASR
jgi:hypothetical protein